MATTTPGSRKQSGRPARKAPAKKSQLIANVEIRPDELQVLVEGKWVGFTVREFELFLLLAERADSVVQRPEIYQEIWRGQMPARDRSIDVLVRKVRAKLAAAAPDWEYIHTHFGIGYRFSPEPIS
ncbi:MAG TPA: winged helix-turn-helix domain-containing protein [Solirubrobacterales bacterium]|nr:winged helix-turn-helix domain-containing protein [Solirubrobacterales bacterium]